MSDAHSEREQTDRLLDAARRGDGESWNRLLAAQRAYLRRVIELRFDPRLGARIDPSDVVQEALLHAAGRRADYFTRDPMPLRVWLRKTACERLVDVTRAHLDADCRAVGREAPLPDDSSRVLARQLLLSGTSVAGKLVEEEQAQRLRSLVSDLPHEDCEIILLRNFEELSNEEAAHVLGIEKSAASKRYGRALLRLRRLLEELGLDALSP